ncbi:Pectate lyase [Psidium guajava]|nr:Pectate lyase [Psidium guajava]
MHRDQVHHLHKMNACLMRRLWWGVAGECLGCPLRNSF